MAKKPGDKPNAPTSREMLKSYVDRITRLEEERKSLGDDIKDIYGEAKSQGFDPKALRKIVKESMQTQTQRAAARETEAIIDLYRASLGLLDGTPLGEAARSRYERELHEADEEAKRDDAEAEGDSSNELGRDPEPEKPREPTPDEAREQGRSDHAAGKRIVDNPFQTGHANRAAWDEGWCTADGSDGMDLPRAWRRNRDAPHKEAGEE